jgi:hypothetical protein
VHLFLNSHPPSSHFLSRPPHTVPLRYPSSRLDLLLHFQLLVYCLCIPLIPSHHRASCTTFCLFLVSLFHSQPHSFPPFVTFTSIPHHSIHVDIYWPPLLSVTVSPPGSGILLRFASVRWAPDGFLAGQRGNDSSPDPAKLSALQDPTSIPH